MTGGEVKAKIGNLVTEYRKRKKEQGRTGASPSPWAHFDTLDRLLGERPYNDDSILSDSITIEDSRLLDEIEAVRVPQLNFTQIREQAHDFNTQFVLQQVAATSSAVYLSSDTSTTLFDATTSQRAVTPPKVESAIKRSTANKKKRACDMKVDLMQQMLAKMDGANELISRSETRALELLERYTQLQAESVQNEREFLDVFKSIANNMRPAH